MSVSRRRILAAGLGASQLALLGGLGLRPRYARAGGRSGPTRLLTIYVNGGWMPELFFTPLSAAGIAATVPPKEVFLGEPCFFDSTEVRNLDGTGDDPDPDDAQYQRIRCAHQWDEAALAAGQIVPQDGNTTPLGWAWKHDNLFEHACVVHGIDVGTAAHLSGKVSMMSGVAGPKFRSPAVHAFVAAAAADRFPNRPLQSVSVAQGLTPVPVHLGPAATPTAIRSTASLENTLSERSDNAWGGLRDRSEHPQYSFAGLAREQAIDSNAIDEFVLARTRRLYGGLSTGTHGFYEDFYETYSIVSQQLGLDLVTQLEQTPGWENFVPSWANPNGVVAPYGVKFGLANGGDSGPLWADSFDLTLKLLKADLCSAISMEVPSVSGFHFDTHDGSTGAQRQYLHVRAVFEIIGRLLHEMKATPTGNGSLLDDTLVMVHSEFSRTWPGTACDHWPSTSVLLAGGGIAGNRQIGNFDLEAGGYSPIGTPIPLRNEGGGNDIVERTPKSADVIYTILQAMGVEDVFIPGGVAEILGVRA